MMPVTAAHTTVSRMTAPQRLTGTRGLEGDAGGIHVDGVDREKLEDREDQERGHEPGGKDSGTPIWAMPTRFRGDRIGEHAEDLQDDRRDGAPHGRGPERPGRRGGAGQVARVVVAVLRPAQAADRDEQHKRRGPHRERDGLGVERDRCSRWKVNAASTAKNTMNA